MKKNMSYYKELEQRVISWTRLKLTCSADNFVVLEGIEILLRISIKILFVLSDKEK